MSSLYFHVNKRSHSCAHARNTYAERKQRRLRSPASSWFFSSLELLPGERTDEVETVDWLFLASANDLIYLMISVYWVSLGLSADLKEYNWCSDIGVTFSHFFSCSFWGGRWWWWQRGEGIKGSANLPLLMKGWWLQGVEICIPVWCFEGIVVASEP